MVAEEIEIIVTARVEEALKGFQRMLPEFKKQLGRIQGEVSKVDFKGIAKNVDFGRVTQQVKIVNKEVEKAKKTMSGFGSDIKVDGLEEQIKHFEKRVKYFQSKVNDTEMKLDFVEENKRDIRERKKPTEDLGANKQYVKLDEKSQGLKRDFISYNSLLKEAKTELNALYEKVAKINEETAKTKSNISGIKFQNVKNEITGISTEFQKLKGPNFNLGNMLELQKYKKKIEEIKPVVKQVSEEISKIGFMKYDSKSIENFIDNYKKEPDGSDVSGMKINGVDFDKVNDDLSNVDNMKQSIKEIGTEAERAKKKVEELSNVKFIDYSKMQAKDLLQPEISMPSEATVVAPSQSSMSMWDILRAKIAQVKPYVEQFKNALNGSGSNKQLELLNYKISELEEKLQGGVNGEVHLSTKEFLGHSSIGVTQVYTHVCDDRIREAFERNPLSDFLADVA